MRNRAGIFGDVGLGRLGAGCLGPEAWVGNVIIDDVTQRDWNSRCRLIRLKAESKWSSGHPLPGSSCISTRVAGE